MKAEFVRISSTNDGRCYNLQFHFTTKRGEKDLPFIVSSYGGTRETCDSISLYFMGENGLSPWPNGAVSVTAEITLTDGSIKKTWTRRDQKREFCVFDELLLQEKDGRPCFEVELTFELGQPDLPKPRKSPFSPSCSPST